jgi:serine phosphatase RsbU (regulator of sigma subunit)
MQILVGWDDPTEAETIRLFLNVDDNTAVVATEVDEFKSQASQGDWDVLLMSLNFPNSAEAFPLFEQVRVWQEKAPILGACYPGEIMQLAKFISHGLHGYIPRDHEGEFILLLNSVVSSAHSAVLAARARQLAERLREEIDSVRQLQESVIPQQLPPVPGYKLTARYEPSQIRILGTLPVVMAGGDYYDVFRVDEHTLVLLVGDAAGHGVKSCMSIMAMHTLVRRIGEQSYRDTAAFVNEINRQLCENAIIHEGGGFITLLYCTLDLRTHRFEWTSAGHPMPVLQCLSTNEVEMLGPASKSGLPLGIDADWEFEPSTITLPENSRLLLYTDGLPEAFPVGGNEKAQFGEAGISATLRESVNLSIEETLEKLFATSNAWTEGSGRPDDTCIMFVERTQ